jgi:CRP/FNR family transcriptional regulator, cyclic AMP receptor protein
MNQMQQQLAEHPFLKGLAPRHLDLLVTDGVRTVQFEPREVIFHEGEVAQRFYLIRHGKVAVEVRAASHGEVRIETIEAGEVLGWSWLVPPYRWHFDARAVELTRAIEMDGARLRELCEKDHDLGYELFQRFTQVIADRLDGTRMQLMDLYGNHG